MHPPTPSNLDLFSLRQSMRPVYHVIFRTRPTARTTPLVDVAGSSAFVWLSLSVSLVLAGHVNACVSRGLRRPLKRRSPRTQLTLL